MKKRDKYLLLSIAAIMFGFAVNVWLAYYDHELPDVVNVGYFGFWTTEIYHIAKIKINDTKNGGN